ncbi:MAG: PIN domain-containing protein [Candidatus Levybacteria bacterium]|nr:PIN domain-containing protein [Candidatus Levybacteria bacterium]
MDFFKKKEEIVNLIIKLVEKGNLAASVLSITELRSGWTDDQAKFSLQRFYKLVEIKNITKEIAELAGEFRWKYKAKGITLPTIDILIAATAIIEDCQMVTGNRRDFPMPELKLYPL